MTVVSALLLLLCDIGDAEYLDNRLRVLAATYEASERRQSPLAVKARVEVMREIAHLPWQGESRTRAARLLARAIANDRAYRVRAEACRAIGRIGTPQAIEAMYRSLFGRAGRSPRYALLDSVLPAALASLQSRADWQWIRRRVLEPSRAPAPTGLVHMAAYRARSMLILTLEGAGRARRAELVDALRPFATHADAVVRAAALQALGRIGAAPDLVQAGLADSSVIVRMAAARAPCLPAVQIDRALLDMSVPVRRMALRNLAERDYRRSVPLLIAQLRVEPSPYARLDIALLLGATTGRAFGEDPSLWSGWWRAQVARRDEQSIRPHVADRRTGTRQVFRAHRVIFLVDASASMNQVGVDGKSRQQKQIETMRAFIGAASRGTRYAVIAFASELRRLPSRAPDVAGGKVLPWVDALKPAGASNSYAALMRALQDPLRPDTIVMLSDGVPRHCSWRGRNYSEPEQILAEVRRANRTALVRIHTVGMLGGISRGDEMLDQESAVAFLRRLASENEGTYREVR